MKRTIDAVHPGALLRTYLEQQGVTVAEAAVQLGITRQQLYRVFTAYSDVSPDLALKLEETFGAVAMEWLRLQAEFDLARLRAEKAGRGERRQAPSV